jgi:hypothetical protein
MYMPTFKTMTAGDSILFSSRKEMNSVCGNVRKYGFKLATRKEEKGYRVWVLSALEANQGSPAN